MKAIFFFLGLATLLGCGGGGTQSDNPPDVAGSYSLSSSDCPTAFAASISVSQKGANVTIDSLSSFFQDASGTVNNSGDFSVSNAQTNCTGQFSSEVATATCAVNDMICKATYARQGAVASSSTGAGGSGTQGVASEGADEEEVLLLEEE